MLKFALPPMPNLKFALPPMPNPDASQWNIGGVGPSGIGHVYFMYISCCLCIIFRVGYARISRRKGRFQWNTGFKLILCLFSLFQLRKLQLSQASEKSRVLQEALHVLAEEHLVLEKSLNTGHRSPSIMIDSDPDDEFYDCDNNEDNGRFEIEILI